MHYEILVEGQGELTALSIIMPNILGEYDDKNTWLIHKHRGIGSIPKDVNKVNPADASLLGQLPAKIKAYNKVTNPNRVVIVLMDLDNKNHSDILVSLKELVPEGSDMNIKFCFAVEELEAWFLGDKNAILAAYPTANIKILEAYIQDSICNTWEVLANVLDSHILKLPKRDLRSLMEKCNWAKKIPPHMDIESNISPSFKNFKESLLEFTNQ